ncbi:MAG: KH domain-containing protein [Candidatus Babeliales bacterium]
MIKQLVEHAIKELVEMPKLVQVNVFHDGPKSNIEIKVAPDDFKRVIGKDGRIIKAIRAMVCAVEPGEKDILVDIAQE